MTYSLIGIGHARSGISFWVSGLACVVLGTGFAAGEARRDTSMLPLSLLRRRTLSPVALVGLLHNVSIYGLIFILSLSFQRLRGLRRLTRVRCSAADPGTGDPNSGRGRGFAELQTVHRSHRARQPATIAHRTGAATGNISLPTPARNATHC
jgi:hypothetical protein